MTKARNIADLGSNDVIETTSTGVDVTGTVTADAVSVTQTGSTTALRAEKSQTGQIIVAYNGASVNYLDADTQYFRKGDGTKLGEFSGGDFHLYEDTGTTAKFVWDASAESLNLGGIATTNTAGFSQNLALKDLYPSITLEDTGTGTGKWTLGVTEGGIGFWDSITTQYRMRIDSSGKVGIGTASPAANSKLHIKGSSSYDGKIIADNSSDTGSGIFSVYQNGTSRGFIGTSGSALGDTSSDMTMFSNGGIRLYTGNGAEKARIDSSGNLLVGKTSTAFGTDGVEIKNDQIWSTNTSGDCLSLNRKTSDGALATFYKDGSTVGSITTRSGLLQIGKGDIGLEFHDADNTIYPAHITNNTLTDNTANLGSSFFRFANIYAANGTIQTSDRNEKQDIEVLSEAEQRVAQACKGLLRKFRWQDAVEEKGDDARIHFGIIAQDLQDAFTAEGLDAGRYAMFISTTWTDEETGEERTRLGVRYSELLAFIISVL